MLVSIEILHFIPTLRMTRILDFRQHYNRVKLIAKIEDDLSFITMHLSPSTCLGRYEILSMLGTGGMGEVYLAHDTRLDRKVALKVLPDAVAGEPDRMKRFEREARAASGLNHPNILTIYDIDQSGSTAFIATEFIEGSTLLDRMRAGPMGPAEVLNVGVQMA